MRTDVGQEHPVHLDSSKSVVVVVVVVGVPVMNPVLHDSIVLPSSMVKVVELPCLVDSKVIALAQNQLGQGMKDRVHVRDENVRPRH